MNQREQSTLEKIQAATLDILEREGAENVSMRRVAAAVGITPMAIYHYFPEREALLRHVTDREFERLADYFNTHWKRNSRRDRFVTMMDGYLSYAFASPRVFDYVFGKPREGARRYPQDFRARRSPTLTPIADALAEAMRNGDLVRCDPWEVAFQMWALAHGYVTLHHAGRIDLDERAFRTLVHRAIRRLMKGLETR